MAMTLKTIQDLHQYFIGVVNRAEHHAQEVEEIIYPLLGMIVAYKDNKTDIEVWSTNDNPGNILWAFFNGTRYAFRYEHEPISIEIRKESYKGDLVHIITNNTTLHQLRDIFKTL